MSPAARKASVKPKSSSPTFALALGGGGARGLAHIHAIRALDELGVSPVAISGASIGAIMGAAMASGMKGQEIEDYARGVVAKPTEVAARIWQSRPASLREVVKRGFKVSQFDVERILKAFLPPPVPAEFSQLKIPLKVAATDFYGHCLHVMEDGDLVSALGASAALPAVFEPVHRDDRLLVDGGLCNPVPYDILTETADIIIAIDVVGAPERGPRRRPSSIDLMYGASQLMMQSIIANKLGHQRPDIFLHPPVSKFRVLDFLKMEEILTATSSLGDELKRAIESAVKAHEKA